MNNKIKNEEEEIHALSDELYGHKADAEKGFWNASQVFSVVAGIIGLVLSATSLTMQNDVLHQIIGLFGILFALALIAVGAAGMQAAHMLKRSTSLLAASKTVRDRYEGDLKDRYARLERAYSKTNNASYLSFTNLARSIGRVSYTLDSYFDACGRLCETKARMDKLGGQDSGSWHQGELRNAFNNFKISLMDEYSGFYHFFAE